MPPCKDAPGSRSSGEGVWECSDGVKAYAVAVL